MFDYLKQFKSLPKELKEKISSPVAMKILTELEEKYKVTLASTVMKVMVKSISINNLASHLTIEFSLNPESAEKLSEELKEKLFFSVSGYLGLKPSFSQEEDEAKKIIKEAGISFEDENIAERAYKIISTFLKGIRSKIDTRMILEKTIEQGGLGLSQEKTENILKICYKHIANLDSKETKEKEIPVVPSSLTDSDGITKIINKEKLEKESEFNLKKEIEAGRTPSITPPLETKKIEGQKEEIKQLSPVKEEEKKEEIKKEEIEKEEIKKEETEERKEDIVSFAPPPKKSIITNIFKISKEEKKNDELKKEKNEEGNKEEAKKEEKKEKIKKEEIKEEKKEIEKEGKEEKKWSSTPRPVSDSGSKKKIEDIRVAPKVMGPIDELRYLDIVNFRRLSEDPKEATLKIRKKIELLGKEGFDKKIQAIMAWKKSPLNLLYVLIGQEAVSHGMGIQSLVEKKLEKNKDSLSWEELKAIMKLNSELSFY